MGNYMAFFPKLNVRKKAFTLICNVKEGKV